MTYTHKQIIRAAKKLSRAIGKWNNCAHPNRAQANVELFRCANALVEKIGVGDEDYRRGFDSIEANKE